VRTTFGVTEQGDDNVIVAEVEDSLRPVRRESSKMVEESKLYAVTPMSVLLLCRGQVGLENSYKVLNIYRRLFPFLVGQLVFFCQFLSTYKRT